MMRRARTEFVGGPRDGDEFTDHSLDGCDGNRIGFQYMGALNAETGLQHSVVHNYRVQVGFFQTVLVYEGCEQVDVPFTADGE